MSRPSPIGLPWFFKAPRPKKQRDVVHQLKGFETVKQATSRDVEFLTEG